MTAERASRLSCVATAMLLMLLDHMTIPHRFHAALRPRLRIALSWKSHYRAVRRDRRADAYFQDLYRMTGSLVLVARVNRDLGYGSTLLLGMSAERAIWDHQECPVLGFAGHFGFALTRWADRLLAGEGAVLLSDDALDIIAFGTLAEQSDAERDAMQRAVGLKSRGRSDDDAGPSEIAYP